MSYRTSISQPAADATRGKQRNYGISSTQILIEQSAVKDGDTLEFNDIYQEVKGSWNDGRLRFSKQNVVYKSSKTGKVDSIAASDINQAQWRRVCLGHGIKLGTSSGHIYKYDGFKDTDFEKISEFFKSNYKVELTEKDMCVKGWNWGTAKFSGPLLSFDINDNPAFEIPLSNVSQCATGKNEVTLEFHQTDETEVSLMEVRFYVPPSQSDERQDPVEAFAQNVLSKADVIQATGDAVCIFKELQCLTPRGRYDIRIYPTFLHLHGKTFDYKIPYTTVLRLFLLPHKDQRQMFFVIRDISLTLNMSEEDVERKFEGKLSKNMSGSLYEMVSRVMKALVNRKITSARKFSGTFWCSVHHLLVQSILWPAISIGAWVHLCAQASGSPSFEEISCVNFARGTTTTRSFDFEIETKQGNQYTFSSIEREEIQGGDEGQNDEYSDSDEDQHDAYLERMKAEGKIREEGNDSDDSDEESDESFNPGEEDDDIAEEYDSKASASESSEEGSGSEDESAKKKKKEKKKEKKVVRERKERKPRKEKKKKDSGGPKRPMSAYMLWLNSSRERIKSENPGISITEISRRLGRCGDSWAKKKKRSGRPKLEKQRDSMTKQRKSTRKVVEEKVPVRRRKRRKLVKKKNEKESLAVATRNEKDRATTVSKAKSSLKLVKRVHLSQTTKANLRERRNLKMKRRKLHPHPKFC
ncbi:hypothetical protein WMY93_008990 [Mugilogobius chulae]|uniref:FACT complex subunit SSRP1 n=1 Tax=Mugilogobius chulae TaxID=88201 RepID=A0AAW0PDS3_9GOBI